MNYEQFSAKIEPDLARGLLHVSKMSEDCHWLIP